MVKGTILSGGLTDLQTSNNARLVVEAPLPGVFTAPWETIVDVNTQVSTAVDELDIRIEGQSNWPNTTGTVRIFNFSTSAFDPLGTYSASQVVDDNFDSRSITPSGMGWDYIRDSDNMVILRLEQTLPQSPMTDALESMYDFVQVVAVDY